MLSHKLKQDAQQAIAIIDKYINIDNILEELKDGTTIRDVEEVIRLQSSSSGLSIEQIARQMMIEKWKKYSSCQEVIAAQEDVDSFSVLLKSYKSLVGNELDLNILQQYNVDMLHCLPLNILILLHQEKILSLLHYLMINVNHENVLKEFIAHLNFLIHNHLSTHEDLITDFLSTLILYGYSGDKYSKGIRKVSGYIVFNIFKTILQHLIGIHVKQQAICFSSVVSKLSSNQNDFHKTCFKQIIGLWITNNPNINAMEAITQQSHWSVSHFNKQLCDVYKEIASCIGFKEIVNCIDNVISRKEVNWKNLLSLISSTYVSSEESRSILQELIERNLSEGLTEQETENLFIAFLFARQVSLEGGHAFTNYAEWFKKHFCHHDGAAVLSSRNFRFLIKFFTKILPHDNVKFLKVHVVKPPHAPTSCKKVLNEYLILARIRLKELGANLEENENQDGKMNKIKDEVQQSLNEYEKFGKIPRSVMEMSIFRKLYFNGKYLQELLKPRILPAKEDIKMKFIKDLYRMQKIPRPMHEKYVQECNQQNTKLVNEIIEIDMDSDFEEDPLQEVEKMLYKIQQKIDNGIQQSGNFDILGLTTDLNRQLSVIEGDKATGDDVVIEICDVNVAGTKAEACDMIFDFYGNWNIQDNPDVIKPLRSVMESILNHQQITTALVNKVWKLCTERLSGISDREMSAVANIVSVMEGRVTVKLCVKNIHRALFKHFDIKHTVHDDMKVSGPFHYMLLTSLPFGNLATNFQNILVLISSLKLTDDRFFDVLCTFIQCRRNHIKENVSVMDETQVRLKRIGKDEVYSQMEPGQFLYLEMLVDENQDILSHFEQRMLYMEILNDASYAELKSLLEILLEHIDLSAIRHNGVPQGCKQFVKVFCECFDVLVEACSSGSSNEILTQVYHNLISKYKTKTEHAVYNEMKRKQISQNIISFILLCSSDVIFLLPSNVSQAQSLWDEGDFFSKSTFEYALKNTALLLHTILQYSDRSFVFSHELTLHIASALTKIGNKYQNAILLYVTAICPEIFVSILYFLNEDAGLSLMLKTRFPKLFAFAKYFRKLLCSVQSPRKRDHEGNHAERRNVLKYLADEMSYPIIHHDNIRVLDDENIDDISEACLAHAIISMANDVTILQAGLPDNVLGLVISGIAINSWQMNMSSTESTSSMNICNRCLEEISPEYFVTSCFAMPTSFHKITDENIKKIYPFLLLRLLCQVNIPIKITSHENYVRSLLELKQNVDNLFANALVDEAIELEGKYVKILKSAVKYLGENERKTLLEIHKTDVKLCQILQIR